MRVRIACMLCQHLSGTLYVIYVPRGAVDLPLDHAERIFSPILIGLGVAIAVWGLTSFASRRTAGYLRLTPRLELQRDGGTRRQQDGSRPSRSI